MNKIDERFRFTPCFEIVSWRYKSYKSKVFDKVFGVIFRYSLLDNGVCYASVRNTLAPAIGISPKVFGETVKVLKKDGLITELEEVKRHTGQYIPNMDKLEELLKEKEQGKVYVDNDEDNTSQNKTKGIPKSFERRKHLLRGEVDNTQPVREIIPHIGVDNTVKEKESLKENLTERENKSELSEGNTPSSVPPDEVETKVSPSSLGNDSSIREAIIEFEESLFKKSNPPLPIESNLEPVSSEKTSETVLKVEEIKLDSEDVDTSSESTESDSENIDSEYEEFHKRYMEKWSKIPFAEALEQNVSLKTIRILEAKGKLGKRRS